MTRQVIDVDGYWKVIVYYNVDYNFFSYIVSTLKRINASEETIYKIYSMMSKGKAKAVTYSNLEKHISIVLFNIHDSIEDYISSIVHEAEHVKQAMLMGYKVEDKGEPPAYTVGYLVKEMWKIFKNFSKSIQ